MAEVDAIMRYIRNFSELSGRIRYAGQKRVLIEMALIRLCRPEMETNGDALLDRIRRLEQTLEKIESGAIAVTALPAAVEGNGSAAAVANRTPAVKTELPKAIPEDVTKIVASWPGIVGNAFQPMKSYLKNARLSLAGDNRLLLVLEDGLASDYFIKDAGNKELLEAMLTDFAGKAVEVEVRAVKNQLEFESSYVDLTQVIHMDIEEE